MFLKHFDMYLLVAKRRNHYYNTNLITQFAVVRLVFIHYANVILKQNIKTGFCPLL